MRNTKIEKPETSPSIKIEIVMLCDDILYVIRCYVVVTLCYVICCYVVMF